MKRTLNLFSTIFLVATLMGTVNVASAQQPASANPVLFTELLKQVLPAGDFRNVQAIKVELAPGAEIPIHRHDVAVLVYVIEGTVENQANGGALQTRKAGEAWWETPGTIHNVTRNVSKTDQAQLLAVFIGEEGKEATVPLE